MVSKIKYFSCVRLIWLDVLNQLPLEAHLQIKLPLNAVCLGDRWLDPSCSFCSVPNCKLLLLLMDFSVLFTRMTLSYSLLFPWRPCLRISSEKDGSLYCRHTITVQTEHTGFKRQQKLIHFSSKYCKSMWSPELKIRDLIILPLTKVWNLGAVIDPHLEMSQHVNAVCRGAFVGICKIGQIQHYLNQNSTMRLVHAFCYSKVRCV